MAELLICVTSQTNPDFYINATLPKRGDVLLVQRDYFPWKRAETRNPAYRILALPGVAVTATALANLTKREVNPTPGTANRLLQFRGYCINPASLPAEAGLAAFLGGGTVPLNRRGLAGGLAAIQAATAQRPPLVAPA